AVDRQWAGSPQWSLRIPHSYGSICSAAQRPERKPADFDGFARQLQQTHEFDPLPLLLRRRSRCPRDSLRARYRDNAAAGGTIVAELGIVIAARDQAANLFAVKVEHSHRPAKAQSRLVAMDRHFTVRVSVSSEPFVQLCRDPQQMTRFSQS